jgi:hypothetical protein
MYMTVLSGRVAREDWNHLQHSFQKLCSKPPEGLVDLELVQGVDDPGEWQVISLWASLDQLEEATRKNLTALCEQMFCDAGSIPRRNHYHLVTRYRRV